MINLTIQNTIQNTIRNTLGDVAFDMLDLFSGGQQGVWYDPSDLATLYQESTGNSPVTADGQPVGLMLDKSRGELLGGEFITNGTFDTDISGWTASNLIVGKPASTLSVESGMLKVIDTVNSYASAYQVINTEVGTRYVLSLYVDSTNAGGGVFIKIGNISEQPNPSSLVSNTVTTGSHSFSFVANNTQTVITLSNHIINTYALFDSISVKEVLGIPAQQPISTQRPTYNATPDRLTLDLVDDSLAFTVPTGGIDGYMVIGTSDGTASYGVSLPAGDYDIGGDYFMGGSVNGFLLREGAVSAADLRNVEKDFVSKGAKASYGDVTSFSFYWRDKDITDFPLIDTSSGTNFSFAWYGNNLTSFPLIDTSSGTNFFGAWFNNNLTSFPSIDTSSGTSFAGTWRNNNLTSFPLIDTSSGTRFDSAWFDNTNLADFPANMFDNCLCTNFTNAFLNTNLTQESIDGILVSIESNGTSNGTFDQSGGSAPSSVGEAAIDAMRSRGWTITVTGGY